jgi:hypothetical protein
VLIGADDLRSESVASNNRLNMRLHTIQGNGRLPSRKLWYQLSIITLLTVAHTTRTWALLTPSHSSHNVLGSKVSRVINSRDKWPWRTQNNPLENRRDLLVLASAMSPIVSYYADCQK